MFHERIKHIDIKYHFVRDAIEEGKLKVCKISTYDDPADRWQSQFLLLSLSFAQA
jgi:hypothetical protein